MENHDPYALLRQYGKGFSLTSSHQYDRLTSTDGALTYYLKGDEIIGVFVVKDDSIYGWTDEKWNILTSFVDPDALVEVDLFYDIALKARAIAHHFPFDENVVVEFEAATGLMYDLMLQAHKKNITLNDHLVEIFRKAAYAEMEKHNEKDDFTSD